MAVNEKIVELLKSVDLKKAVLIENRYFVGPEEALTKAAKLEELALEMKELDLFTLYNKTIAFDGLHDEDINNFGRFFAYLRFELKGITPDEKRAALEENAKTLVEHFGYDVIKQYIPDVIKGRQVTDNLTIRPENEDYPSYYSKMRMQYAEKMALEELPKHIIIGIRNDQEVLVNKYDWDVVYTTEPLPEKIGNAIEACNTVYIVGSDAEKQISLFAELWNLTLKNGIENFYDIKINHDGAYPEDEFNPFGRFFAYVKAELKGLTHEERYATLAKNFPDKLLTGIGESLEGFFPEYINGIPVTQVLTLRPDNDDYPSYYIKKKIEEGNLRVLKQILYDLQAAIGARIEAKAGPIRKLIILSGGDKA